MTQSIDIYEALLTIKAEGKVAVLITVVEKEGHGPQIPGSKMLCIPDGPKLGTVGGGALEYAAVNRVPLIIQQKTSQLKRYLMSPDNEVLNDKEQSERDSKSENTGMICGGTITLFFEYICPGERLYIFGAGHVGKALAFHLKNLNFYTWIIDSRVGLADSIEGVQRRITSDAIEGLKNDVVPPGGYFLIATHSHALDYVILKDIYLAGWNPKYIGLIASKRKGPVMIDRLRNEIGSQFDPTVLYTPVGLDIGGTTPDEIAISIIAELQAIRYNKSNLLRKRDYVPERDTPVYDGIL